MSLPVFTALMLAEVAQAALTPTQMTEGYRQVAEFKRAHLADVDEAAAMMSTEPRYRVGTVPKRAEMEMERHEFLRWTRSCKFKWSYQAPPTPKGGYTQVGEAVYLDCPARTAGRNDPDGERIEVSYFITSRGDGVTVW